MRAASSATCNVLRAGDRVGYDGQEHVVTGAVGGSGAVAYGRRLRVVDDVVIVHLDGHEPAPATPAVIGAAYLAGFADADHETTYTDTVACARARLAVADLDAAMRGPVERVLIRERIAADRRRRLTTEAEEQARLHAALVAALDVARAGRA